jgi:hypothetical protein
MPRLCYNIHEYTAVITVSTGKLLLTHPNLNNGYNQKLYKLDFAEQLQYEQAKTGPCKYSNNHYNNPAGHLVYYEAQGWLKSETI